MAVYAQTPIEPASCCSDTVKVRSQMIFRFRITSLWGALAIAVVCFGARAIAQQNDAVAERKIADLSRKLENADNERDRALLAKSVRSELKAFVEGSLRGSDNSATIQQRLRNVLRSQNAERYDSDPPTIREANLRYGRSVVVAYSVFRPPHFDLATITAFTDKGGDFREAATTGDDLEGYMMVTQLLPSPTKDVMWLLAGGKAFTFNGSRYRFRVYTFDGERFETIWSPEDVYNATIQLSVDGFSLTHHKPQEDAVTEKYLATPNGLIQVR